VGPGEHIGGNIGDGSSFVAGAVRFRLVTLSSCKIPVGELVGSGADGCEPTSSRDPGLASKSVGRRISSFDFDVSELLSEVLALLWLCDSYP
jgi:hypothetical protein